MKLVQCWDDGVTTDVRLVSLLRHGAGATFNLNAGLHRQARQFGWRHADSEVWRLGLGELRKVYDGFGIATTRRRTRTSSNCRSKRRGERSTMAAPACRASWASR